MYLLAIQMTSLGLLPAVLFWGDFVRPLAFEQCNHHPILTGTVLERPSTLLENRCNPRRLQRCLLGVYA